MSHVKENGAWNAKRDEKEMTTHHEAFRVTTILSLALSLPAPLPPSPASLHSWISYSSQVTNTV